MSDQHRIIITALILAAVSLWAPPVHAWEAVKIKCKVPEAQKLFDEEYNLLVADFSDTNVDQAIVLMEKATAIEPTNDMLWVELSGNLWERGDRLPKDTDAQKKIRLGYFNRGLEAAKKALAVKESAAAHFWLATNLASGGEMKGILKSVPMFPTLVRETGRCDQLDPHYGRGATARFWSEVISRVPDNVVRMVGMKPDDAINAIQAEIKRDPIYFDNRVYMANYLHRLEKNDEALAELQFVLSHDPNAYPDPAQRSTQRRQQEIARKMWKDWTGKDYPNK